MPVHPTLPSPVTTVHAHFSHFHVYHFDQPHVISSYHLDESVDLPCAESGVQKAVAGDGQRDGIRQYGRSGSDVKACT